MLPLAKGTRAMQTQREAGLQLFLDRLTRRSVLSRREREAILALPAQPWVLSANSDFVRQGDRVEHTSLIVSGVIARSEQVSNGSRQITNFYVRGDMPDLHSVVQPTASSALEAVSGAAVLRVPHSALRAAAATYPGIAEAFWRDCVVDLMVHAQWVVNVGRRNAQSRIAHLLCEMACRYGARVVDGKVTYHLPVSQAHLAEATGLTAVHVNRSLSALRKSGLFFQGRTVRIEDWDELVRLAGFDPAYLQESSVEPVRIAALGQAA